METLASSDNPAFRRLRRLMQEASARREEGRALVEGPHLSLEAVLAGAARQVWASEAALEAPWSRELFAAAHKKGLKIRYLTEGLFAKVSDTRTPQGCLCEVEPAALAFKGQETLLIALDALQDPGNMGTLLRCAWAAGAAVVAGKGCADPWSPKVLRAGAGAHFHAPILETQDLPGELARLSETGVAVYATAPRAERSYLEADALRPCCWVLGSEGLGLAPEVQAVCSGTYRIPYPGQAESLNAAVSGAILLFEALRQRSLKKA